MDDRSAAVLRSRAWITVAGPDAAAFLQGLISNDVEKAGTDRAVYAALLTPQGKYLYDFFVVREGDALWLDADRGRCGALVKRLQMYKLRAKVELSERPDFEVVASWGGAEQASVAGQVSFADPRHPGLGARARVASGGAEKAAQKLSARLVPEREYHKRRILLGVPDGTMDLEAEQTFLLEGNFEELNGVDFKKGCYVGQELTARMKHRGTARRRMLPVKGSSSLPGPGTQIVDESGREIGQLRGSIGDIGMAGFRLDRLKEARQLTADGVRLEILRSAYSVIGWETLS